MLVQNTEKKWYQLPNPVAPDTFWHEWDEVQWLNQNLERFSGRSWAINDLNRSHVTISAWRLQIIAYFYLDAPEIRITALVIFTLNYRGEMIVQFLCLGKNDIVKFGPQNVTNNWN